MTVLPIKWKACNLWSPNSSKTLWNQYW